MPSKSPQRRPVDLCVLDQYAEPMKLRGGLALPKQKRKTVSVPRDSFVPVIQAEVGSVVPLLVHRYRVLVPLVQIIAVSKKEIKRVLVASDADIETIHDTLTSHFGGVTLLHQPPAPALGMGARDPANVRATREQNEHLAFEVYAAPIQESDDYFQALRRELQETLQEGVILVERQQVTLI